jgi:hypothetical protein
VETVERSEVIKAGAALASQLQEQGLSAKLIGGVACALHQHDDAQTEFLRSLGDVDLVVPAGTERNAARALEHLGWEGRRRFNALHGDQRMMFDRRQDGLKLDVMIGDLRMCQVVALDQEWRQAGLAVTVTTLLLTKLQIHELTDRDITDILGLLVGHDVAASGGGAHDVLSASALAEVAGESWEWYRSIDGSLATLEVACSQGRVPATYSTVVADRVGRVRDAIHEAPKSRRWRLRSRIGERKRWYNEPEEVG